MPKATKDRKPRKRSPSTKPQERPKHPPQWEQDLNPKRMEGQNIGANPAQNDPRARAAAEIKSLTERLQDFNMDELAQIPIVPAGTQLKQGAVYLDLRDPAPVPFTATAGIVAGEHNYYTPKQKFPTITGTGWSRRWLLLELAGLKIQRHRQNRFRPKLPRAMRALRNVIGPLQRKPRLPSQRWTRRWRTVFRQAIRQRGQPAEKKMRARLRPMI
jgi:hypothetical protein